MHKFPQMSARRIVIYPKDIALITGRTERTAWRKLAQARKAPRDFVTMNEFCLFAGFEEWEVLEMLG